MTTKTITTYISAGYTLSAAYSTLSITSTGGVGGVGVVAGAAATVVNAGVVNGKTANGITLKVGGDVVNLTTGSIGGAIFGVLDTAGHVSNYGTLRGATDSIRFTSAAGAGTITNGGYAALHALIAGPVYFAGSGTLTNSGTIQGNVAIHNGGRVTNGAANNQGAQIDGEVSVQGAPGIVANSGTIEGFGQIGVFLFNGGTVFNGAATDTTARISGFYGVEIISAFGSVTNFGAIQGTEGLSGAAGVKLIGGGLLTNGTALDPGAIIEGYNGAYVGTIASTVANFGTILGQGVGAAQYGLRLRGGGTATNGSAGGLTALIEGANGVGMTVAGTVVNYGAVVGATHHGVVLHAGGSVVNLGAIRGAGDGVELFGGALTNGGGANRSASIEGDYGVVGLSAPVTVHNFGLIKGSNSLNTAGVRLANGGALVNGSLNNNTALIEGQTGLNVYGPATLTNFGTLLGLADSNTLMEITGYGAVIDGGVSLTNGAAGHTGALIEGYAGVTALYESNTVTNFGTIEGANGVAVSFRGYLDVLVVEAGSSFLGSVDGGLGTLELANGVGTLSGLFAGGTVTVSGSMAPTTFGDFGTLTIDAPASFTATAGGVIAAGQTLNVAGTLATAGGLAVAGALTVTGTLAGTGTLALTAGTSNFNNGAALTIAKVTQSGGTANIGSTALTYAGVWTQTAGTVSASAGDRINFSGAGDAFAGTLAGAGTIAFTGGTDALTGTTLTAASVLIKGGAVTLSGTIANTGVVTVTSPNVVVATAGVTLTGAGSIALSSSGASEIVGATAGATLTNAGNKIFGAGNLGGGLMKLVNQAGGLIFGNNATVGLTIDTGAASITNAGIIENTGAAGTTIDSAVNNTGTLKVTAGVLTVNGAVTGAGMAAIAGGTADFASAFAENVAFTGATGVLELSNSQTYTGQVTGFSKTGTTSLDLADIGFASGTTKASYSGTTASGTLTVTDGTHTAKITLVGDYTGATFTVSSDGHGGTTVVDPTRQGATQPRAPMLPFVAAMAGFAARAGPLTVGAQSWRGTVAALAAPRSHPA